MADRPSVSVAVMAHPRREAFVAELVEALDRPAKVIWDERQDRWDTGRRSLLAYDPSCTHHLVVQDDAVVCRDLVAGVERALAHVPAKPGVPTPLCLYIGNITPYHTQVSAVVADAGDASWLTMGGVFWGVAIVMPTELIEPMVRWGDSRGRHIQNYDKRIGTWLDERKITTWYPWPNLVDHRDSPSLVSRNRLRGRHAHRFIGRDASALDLDWSGGVLQVPSVRRYQGRAKTVAPRREDLMQRAKTTESKPVSGDLMTPRGVNVRSLRLIGVKDVPSSMVGRHKLIPGVTVAHADSWIVGYRPEMWEPLRIDYPADGPAAETSLPSTDVADYVEVRDQSLRKLAGADGPGPDGATGVEPEQPDDGTVTGTDDIAPPAEPAPKPAAKDVRAWAKAQRIDVPSSGPIPAEVADRYRAVHERTDW